MMPLTARSARTTAGRFGELVGVLVAVGCAGTAFGQGTLLGSDQRAYADAYWRLGSNYQRNLGDTHDTTSFDSFYAVEDRAHQFEKFSGRGYAEHGATYSPTTPGFMGQFSSVIMDACTSAEIWTPDSNNSEDRATGLAQGIVTFSVDTPQDWTWVGAWQGFTYDSGAYYSVRGHISLVDAFSGAQIVWQDRQSLNGTGDWNEPIGFAGTLLPGTYTLTWMHESIVANGNTPWGFYGVTIGGSPLVSCVNSTFTLVPVPGPSVLGVVFGGLVLAGRRRR